MLCSPAINPLTPPQVQHSIRVGGQPFPDWDLHPARCAKLILARHPEVIVKRTDDMNCLLEAMFDLKAQPVQLNDVQGCQGEISRHQGEFVHVGIVSLVNELQ